LLAEHGTADLLDDIDAELRRHSAGARPAPAIGKRHFTENKEER